MLISRCSSGAASVSSTLWTIPVNRETNVLSRGSAWAAGVGWTGRSSTADSTDLLVPGERRRDIGDARTGGTAWHSMDVMHGQAEHHAELDPIERRRYVLVAENQPLERQGGPDTRNDRLDGGGRRIRRRHGLESSELFTCVEVGHAAEPKAFEATGLLRDVERTNRRVPAVERQHLQPGLARGQRLPVPVDQPRQLRRRRRADREIDIGWHRLVAPSLDAALPEQPAHLDRRRPAADDGDGSRAERGGGLVNRDPAAAERREELRRRRERER